MIKVHFFLWVSLILAGWQNSFANNIQVSNVVISNINTSGLYAEVQLDLSWSNSWRDNSNWDGAWVFIKYRAVGSSAAWQHATLNYVNGVSDGHTIPSNAIINTPADGKGVFVYRNVNGQGNILFDDIKLRWSFGVDGLTTVANVDIKVFALEMVNVPQGSFYVGDGQTTGSEIYGNFEANISGAPFQVTSENAITLGGGQAGSLGNNNRENHYVAGGGGTSFDCSGSGCVGGSGDDFNDVTSQVLPAAFPKGYNAFYAMKYELTQQAFVDMLNCASPTQQALLSQTSHYYVPGGQSLAGNRFGIDFTGSSYATSHPQVPMIYLDWIRAAAFADWAALRPMTELEFEKACRGLGTPVVNEFAWGNANIDLSNDLILNNVSAIDEGIASGYDAGGVNGNCWVQAGSQTMNALARVGIFAANAGNTGRVTSGATIWGMMDMSGNAWERTVSVGHTEGRKFTGLHGDGNLDVNGYANVVNWPGTFGGSPVNANVGVGYRGGALVFPTPNLERNARVSNRRLASGYWNLVIQDDGCRFVRSAN